MIREHPLQWFVSYGNQSYLGGEKTQRCRRTRILWTTPLVRLVGSSMSQELTSGHGSPDPFFRCLCSYPWRSSPEKHPGIWLWSDQSHPKQWFNVEYTDYSEDIFKDTTIRIYNSYGHMAMGQVALSLLQKNQTAAENLMAMDDSSPQGCLQISAHVKNQRLQRNKASQQSRKISLGMVVMNQLFLGGIRENPSQSIPNHFRMCHGGMCGMVMHPTMGHQK